MKGMNYLSRNTISVDQNFTPGDKRLRTVVACLLLSMAGTRNGGRRSNFSPRRSRLNDPEWNRGGSGRNRLLLVNKSLRFTTL